jgi:hypothetical protein
MDQDCRNSFNISAVAGGPLEATLHQSMLRTPIPGNGRRKHAEARLFKRFLNNGIVVRRDCGDLPTAYFGAMRAPSKR